MTLVQWDFTFPLQSKDVADYTVWKWKLWDNKFKGSRTLEGKYTSCKLKRLEYASGYARLKLFAWDWVSIYS